MSYVKTVLLLLLTMNSFAQGQPLELIGEIINNETKEAVPYVHVLNTSTNSGTASNTEGRFWMSITPGDTLVFSAIGFQTYQLVTHQNITTDQLVMSITLSPSTLELETVKVFAFKDEYALKRALIDSEVTLESDDKGLMIPGLKTVPSTTKGRGIVINGPLSAIGNLFSKEVKEQKKMTQITKEYGVYKNTQEKYNKKVVMEITGLPEDKAEDFITFCQMDDGYLEKATAYEIAVVINRCLVDFNRQEKD